MHCICLVKATPTSPEIVILQLDSEEHKALHHDALQFVNEKKIFGRTVRSAELVHTKLETGLAIGVHLPGCASAIYCDAL